MQQIPTHEIKVSTIHRLVNGQSKVVTTFRGAVITQVCRCRKLAPASFCGRCNCRQKNDSRQKGNEKGRQQPPRGHCNKPSQPNESKLMTANEQKQLGNMQPRTTKQAAKPQTHLGANVGTLARTSAPWRGRPTAEHLKDRSTQTAAFQFINCCIINHHPKRDRK